MKKNVFVSLLIVFLLSVSFCVSSAQQGSADPQSAEMIHPALYAAEGGFDYSTNSRSTIKNGNSGVYAYKSRGGSYSIYWIIDFDKGYVYYFVDGNGEMTCDRVKMVSGNLNSVLIITYHEGGTKWSYGLHFKYKNQPDHLIVQDNDGFEYDFYPTNLKNALSLRNKRTIINY